MDSITQAVLGAAIGETMFGKELGGRGAVAGAIIATIPDLDVVLYLLYDSFDMLSIHRGFSHSILFCLLGALPISLILSRTRWFHSINFKSLLIFSWLCLFTHVLLDMFTAYGTQIFLPFSNIRFGFDSVNVIDPFYTVPLILGLTLSLWIYKSNAKRTRFNNLGLVISSVYLIITLVHKVKVESDFVNNLSLSHKNYTSILSIPVGVGNYNWYCVANGQDSIYMQQYALHSSTNYPIESFPIHENYLLELDKDVANKMRWFAKGFYTVEKENGAIRIYNLQVDMRGIQQIGNKKAPTAGYFEFSKRNGETEYSTGTIQSNDLMDKSNR